MSDERDNIREDDGIRDSVTYRGPMSFPKSLKDPAYFYYCEIYNPRRAWAFNAIIDKGFEYVTTDMVPGLEERLPDHRLCVDGNRIGVVCDKIEGTVQYLMRIPKERHEQLKAIRNKRVNGQITRYKKNTEIQTAEAKLTSELDHYENNIPITHNK